MFRWRRGRACVFLFWERLVEFSSGTDIEEPDQEMYRNLQGSMW